MLWIQHAEYLALRQHGEAAYPHESCGVLLGSALGDDRLVRRAVPCHNGRTDSPGDRYHLDPLELAYLDPAGGGVPGHGIRARRSRRSNQSRDPVTALL